MIIANANNTQHLWRPIALSLTLILLSLLQTTGKARAEGLKGESSGTELAQMVYDRPSGKDASAKIVMLLQSKDKAQRQRLMYSYAKNKGDSERWTLLRFIEPKDVEKTGLLTLDYKGDDSDQWLYLPALDRVRRISSSRKGGRFVGSDFNFEDLMDREVTMDHHRLIGKNKLGGIECHMLESVPVVPDSSVYSKRVSWIHPELLLPLRVDLYQNNHGEPIKRLRATKIKKVQDYWTVFESTMFNLKTGHKTLLKTTDILYDQELPDELFTQHGLADDSREKAFRP